MTTLELKNSIIQKIALINDPEFLKTIKTIVDAKQEGEVFITSDGQKKRIEYSIDQIKQGDTLSHDSLVKEINEWLEKK